SDQLRGNNSNEDERVVLYRNALEQFISSPIYGDQVMVKEIHSYPHNLVMEVLMALGIIGFIPLLMIFRNFFKRFVSVIKCSMFNFIIFFLIAINFIFQSLTSFSIFTNPGLWMILGLCLSISTTF